MFKINDIVTYGTNGVCKITGTEEKDLMGTKKTYLVLKPTKTGDNSTYFVPVDNENLLGKMRKLLSEDEKKKMNETEESLANISRIPEYVQLFVTTSKNKEGINIHNDDLRNMFVETHLMYDAVQMAGRVRVGLENLYIISDAEPINNYGNPVDIPFSKEILVKNKDSENSADEVNKFLIKYLESIKKTTPEKDERRRRIMNYVNYIEEKFPYVRYNVFKDEFEFFHTKEKAEKMVLRENEKFKKAVATRDHSYIREWFPYSEVKNELSVQAQAYTYLKNLIGINKYVILTTDELKLYLSRIREWFNSKLTSPNSILHLVDKNFNCEKLTNRYKLYYGKESPKIKGTAMKKHHK